MKKSNKIIIAVFILFFMLSTFCFAETTKSDKLKMEIVEKNVCTINIKDSAVFEKKLIDYNLDKKELTLQMKITNTATPKLSGPAEVMFVIDVSDSMAKPTPAGETTGETKMEAIKNSASKLAKSLLEQEEDIKVGIVTFSTTAGGFGTLADAQVVSELSDSYDDLNTKIEAIECKLNTQTDIEAGITLANEQFSGEVENKYMVLLTDGVPNYSLAQNTFNTGEITITHTRGKLEQLTNDGIRIITVMSGLLSTDYITIDNDNNETIRSRAYAELIFGSSANPKFGEIYYTSYDNVEQVITENVLTDIVGSDGEDGILTNIDIYDYFPQDIIDNFNFEYVSEPDKGTISAKIDPDKGCIIWHIDQLGYGESATVSYKLTVKDTVNSEIINKIISTNKKVDITANELDDTLTSDKSPKVRLTGDPTTSPKVIPETGLTNTSIIAISIILFTILIVGIKLYRNKDIK